MILVSVNKSAAQAVSDEQFREAAEGAWKISEDTMRGYGDYVAAVRDNVIRGVWRVADYRRDDETGKVTFSFAPAVEAAELIGREVPTPWVRGAANPIKTWGWVPDHGVNRSAMSVELQGWTLSIRDDDAAQIVSPEGEGPLVLEALIGEPMHSVAVLRTL